MEETKDFERIFLEAVEEGLAVLGEGGKYMVFSFLERNCSIRKQDIPKNPEAFVSGLEKIFGAGAPVLERMIIERMYEKLGLKKRRRRKRLIECVKEVAQASSPLKQPSEEPEELDSDPGLTPRTAEGYQADNNCLSSISTFFGRLFKMRYFSR
jgi:hypothetical protein